MDIYTQSCLFRQMEATADVLSNNPVFALSYTNAKQGTAKLEPLPVLYGELGLTADVLNAVIRPSLGIQTSKRILLNFKDVVRMSQTPADEMQNPPGADKPAPNVPQFMSLFFNMLDCVLKTLVLPTYGANESALQIGDKTLPAISQQHLVHLSYDSIYQNVATPSNLKAMREQYASYYVPLSQVSLIEELNVQGKMVITSAYQAYLFMSRWCWFLVGLTVNALYRCKLQQNRSVYVSLFDEVKDIWSDLDQEEFLSFKAQVLTSALTLLPLTIPEELCDRLSQQDLSAIVSDVRFFYTHEGMLDMGHISKPMVFEQAEYLKTYMAGLIDMTSYLFETQDEHSTKFCLSGFMQHALHEHKRFYHPDEVLSVMPV